MKPQNINSIVDYLHRHSATPELARMAAHFGYSQWYFSRLFKEATGVTLREYQSALKVQQAIISLSSNDSVINAQLAAGYESAGSFTHVFQKSTGLSPQHYRQTLITFSQQLPHVVDETSPKAITYQFYSTKKHQQSNHLNLHIHGQSTPRSLLFVALFKKPMPKGTPTFAVCLRKRDNYRLTAIPNGTYFAMVCEIDPSRKRLSWLNLDTCQRDLCYQPITFPLQKHQTVVLTLREKRADDPPILVNPLKLLFDVIAK